MKILLALLVLGLASFIEVDCKTWALLVAGSNGYYNYRHQADVCHSYQVLHKHGIPDENIVVMMFDDIANYHKNPTKGVIINKPNGTNVYKGVLKDYTGFDVTPKNFLNVLMGNKEAMNGIGSGKVIDSGPDDNVFVYFADHGAPGLIAFPDEELHASKLQGAIMSMHENKKYKQMVFYIEACESGSMFDKTLPKDIKVFATTAANHHESSYACYWDERRGTYLGDVYSVKWMEDSDKENLAVETLQEQFKIVRKEVNTSHVKEFGDMSISKEALSNFQGSSQAEVFDHVRVPITDAVPSPDVPLIVLHKRLELAKTKPEYLSIEAEIQKEENTRSLIRVVMKKIVHKLVADIPKQFELLQMPAKRKDVHCYESAVKIFRSKCFNFSKYEYALRQIFVLSNLCDEGISIDMIKTVTEHVCESVIN